MLEPQSTNVENMAFNFPDVNAGDAYFSISDQAMRSDEPKENHLLHHNELHLVKGEKKENYLQVNE